MVFQLSTLRFEISGKTRLSLAILLAAMAVAGCAAREGSNANRLASMQARERRASQPCVNINTATAEQLMALPAVGEVMSRRIIEYRERHGPFRRPEQVIIIEGFSERRFRTIADRICVE